VPKRESFEQKPSTGNVFADLGLADTGEHLIKTGLVVRIDRTIRQRKLTQAAVAKLMRIDRPKISAMLSGQFRGYSVERLMRFLVALRHDVELIYALLLDRIGRAYKNGVEQAFGSDIVLNVPGKTRGDLALAVMDAYVDADGDIEGLRNCSASTVGAERFCLVWRPT
jgi:predicted XRE-type DNA-binding protein